MASDNNDTTPRAAHDGYVHRVAAELGQRGVTVTDLTIAHSAIRHASMTVAVVDSLFDNWADADWVRLQWTERDGWSYLVQYQGESQPRQAVHFGLTAVPDPGSVADWMHICLEHPELVPGREDGPFTTPELDNVLRIYPAHTV